ncbi:MAG: bifunctional UDP-N-acetylglucosamine pyrophosphorylase/glucosamine-1-phosphate N-acetyltransferase [Verrucomicrobiales bacterium]|jgi:bifunctional UDP-N-acetylglucosamine pyrophosphorylase/glucosamine-1-phosphate N-acetyltransferase
MDRTQIVALIVPTQPARDAKSPSGAADPFAPIAGKSILGWIVDAALGASVRRIGILADEPMATTRSELYARADDALIEFVTPGSDLAESMAFAIERLGSELTLRDAVHVLILPAEAPHIDPAELRALIDNHLDSNSAATLIGGPSGEDIETEPIIVRDDEGRVTSIVDAPISDVGVLCVRASLLAPALRRVAMTPWQTGAPLSQIAGVLEELGHKVTVVSRHEPLGTIWSSASRTPIEIELRDRIITSWIDRGAVMPDPRQVSIDATVVLGQGVQILPGSVVEGTTVVADGAIIGPNTHLVNASIGTGAIVPHSVVYEAEVAAREQVPPFSVLGSATR